MPVLNWGDDFWEDCTKLCELIESTFFTISRGSIADLIVEPPENNPLCMKDCTSPVVGEGRPDVSRGSNPLKSFAEGFRDRVLRTEGVRC